MRYGWQSTLSRRHALVALAAIALSTPYAYANTTDWVLGAGGTYTSSGGAGSVLSGSNIPVLLVSGDGTPLDNGVALPIVDGFLDFTSGAYNGNGSNWSWGAGGVLTLTGCIPGVTATVCTGSNNVALISDDFQSVKVQNVLGSLDLVFGNIAGMLNTQLAAYFGVSTSFSTASFATSILTSGGSSGSLNGTNLLGQIKATPSTAVPEAWSLGESLVFLVLVFGCFAVLYRFRILRLAPAR